MIDTSAQNTLKNSGYNFIGFVIPVLAFVLVTPIIITKLGIKEYGVYIFLNTIVMFLGLLDLGIGTATSKHFVEYYSKNELDNLKKIFYSMNTVYFILASVYFFVCIGIGIFIQFILYNNNPEVNYFWLFCVVGLNTFINTIFANFTNALVTLQRIDLHIKIFTIFLVISNLSMLILASLGYKLIYILFVQLIISLVSCLMYFFTARKVLPILQLKYDWVKEEIVKNYKYGLTVAFNNIATSSLVHFDKLIVPIFVGPSQLTYYGVSGGITNRISGISSTFSSLLFPITVSLHSLNEIEKIKRVYIRSVRLITILSAAISFAIIFMADKILLYWLNEDFAEKATMVLILLVLTNFILALYNPLSNLLMAMNKMKFLTLGSLIMAIINVVSLFILLPLYGINGAALAYLIGVLPIIFMFYFAEKKYFNVNYIQKHIKLFFSLIITAIPFFVIERFLLYPFITNFITVVFIGPLCVLLFLIMYKIFGFVEQEDWVDFKLFFYRFLKKLKLVI